MKHLTVANRWNVELIDQKYSVWLQDPEGVDKAWQTFFEGFELGLTRPAKPAAVLKEGTSLDAAVLRLIQTYRMIGHRQAKINPLFSPPKEPELSIEAFGFSKNDLEKEVDAGTYFGDKKVLKLGELVKRLEKTYCGTVGYEFAHIQDTQKRKWLEAQVESSLGEPNFSKEQRKRILEKIISAETFEHFLHTRYVGQKRFSLEGGETLIVGLDAILELSPAVGVEEIVLGMAHRGRLNVLAGIFNKSYDYIFKEFSENYIPDTIYGDGDVKYHLGFESNHKTESGKEIAISLAPNPSHLESVDAIVEGKARARQRIRGLDDRRRVLPILIHGDAALPGQGVVVEVLNLSKLEGYTTAGTIHIVINNQIGFTTAPEQGRSTRYCTDVAKTIDAPIFHVNGDDPLAMAMVAELTLKYRQKFSEDVFIDMYCYRRHGHNEADEPAFTQPGLYKKIAEHPPISEVFVQHLLEDGSLTAEEAKEIKKGFEDVLHEAFERNKAEREFVKKNGKQKKHLSTIQPPYSFKAVQTAVDRKVFDKVCNALLEAPVTFNINPKIKRQLEAKKKVVEEGKGFDWGFGEALAFGTLLLEGTPVRLSGQDSERGTFSHRHSVYYDVETHERYIPLCHIDETQGIFCVHNSSLSEAAVLGFDLGYSFDYPKMLCLWEAQFGDFANGAQVVIDQFMVSGESKWNCVSGIVLLLPHGYEGQGPEHSSARLERFLQACAEDNIQVCNLTTPAQYFHVLRRQMKRDFKKPLIIMSPKSLLRHKNCTSSVEDFTKGKFETILDDTADYQNAKRVILCSGKVYYDLLAYREEKKIKDTALVRIEQLYPLNDLRLRELFGKYAKATRFVWCQEEPHNMGAWNFIASRLQTYLGNHKLEFVGRWAAASPATGVLAVHKVEQEALVETAFVK